MIVNIVVAMEGFAVNMNLLTKNKHDYFPY